MDVFYRLLGVVAAANQRMSRFYIRFVPSNWFVMIGSVVALIACVAEIQHANVVGSKPKIRLLSSILAHDDMVHDYVTTSGTLDPGHGFEYDKTGYALLTDEATHRAILVEAPAAEMNDAAARPATVTGILKEMPTDLQKSLTTGGGSSGPVPIDTNYYLDEGAKPGDPIVLTLLAVVSAVVFGLFFGTWLMKYIVFQREASTFQPGSLTPTDAAPSGPVSDLRATGRFYLNEKTARRFLHMPASVGTTQDGHLALLANVDASSRMFGFTTQKRAGMWAMVVTRGTVRVIEPGLHYFGWNGRPALRFQYVDGMTGKSASGLVSFNDRETRDIVARDLQDPTLKPPPAPPTA